MNSCNDSVGTKTASGGAGHLDTSTLGAHVYTVTAVSKDGRLASSSIGYTVVLAPQLPDGSQGPPDVPEEPPLRVKLSLGVERESLSKLLRTGKLVVVARINEAAKVELAGNAELKAPGRGERRRSVAVFESKTAIFAGPGEKKLTLALSRKGREALRHLPKLRLAIAGKAIDTTGETTSRMVALTLLP